MSGHLASLTLDICQLKSTLESTAPTETAKAWHNSVVCSLHAVLLYSPKLNDDFFALQNTCLVQAGLSNVCMYTAGEPSM